MASILTIVLISITSVPLHVGNKKMVLLLYCCIKASSKGELFTHAVGNR